MDKSKINEIADEVVKSVLARKFPNVKVYDKRNREVGKYEFFFWINDEERAHVHVKRKGGGKAKVWLDNLTFDQNNTSGFNESELSEILKLMKLNKEMLSTKWSEYKQREEKDANSKNQRHK